MGLHRWVIKYTDVVFFAGGFAALSVLEDEMPDSEEEETEEVEEKPKKTKGRDKKEKTKGTT